MWINILMGRGRTIFRSFRHVTKSNEITKLNYVVRGTDSGHDRIHKRSVLAATNELQLNAESFELKWLQVVKFLWQYRRKPQTI